MNNTNNNEPSEKLVYNIIYKKFAHATQATNLKTGKVIQLSPDVKLVYADMLELYNYAKNPSPKTGGVKDYFESWGRIFARNLGIGKRWDTARTLKIIRCLKDLGLVVESDKKYKDGIKIVKDLKEIIEVWKFENPSLETFISAEAKAERNEAKQQRLSKARTKITKPTQEQPKIEHPQTPTIVEQAPLIQQPQTEPMLCNGNESYFTEQPPLSVYESDYVVDDEDLEVVVDSQVSIEDCPKFFMCEREWQSVIESYTGTDIEQATQQESEKVVAPSQPDEVIERVEPPITPPPEKATLNIKELLLECGLLPFTRAGALKDTLQGFDVDEVMAVNKTLIDQSYYCKECGNYTHNMQFCNYAGCGSIPF